MVSTNIAAFETGKALPNYVRNKRMPTGMVIPVLGEYDISQLPSGNYKLVLEVRNRENQVLTTSSLFFQRSNPRLPFQLDELASVDVASTFAAAIVSPDTLAEYIRSLAPI